MHLPARCMQLRAPAEEVGTLKNRWVLGWVAGAAVLGVAGGLLVTITCLARKVAKQAAEIREAVDGSVANTDALWELEKTSAAVAGLAGAR